MNFARTFLKVWLWFLSFVNLVMKYCMNLVYIYFLRAKKEEENMGELRDAAFASCWGSAAMETKQIWTWVCSCSIIYCVDCFIFKSGWGQGISIFFSNSLKFLFTVLFNVFFFFFFLIFSTVICPSLSWYWKCFWTYYTFILVELLV